MENIFDIDLVEELMQELRKNPDTPIENLINKLINRFLAQAYKSGAKRLTVKQEEQLTNLLTQSFWNREPVTDKDIHNILHPPKPFAYLTKTKKGGTDNLSR